MNESQKAHDLAKISTSIEKLTTAEILLALTRAWDCGHGAGFHEGFERGQKAASSAINAVMGAL